jgi:threonine dehydrogenase-like Zn-dependent dehydrogenase
MEVDVILIDDNKNNLRYMKDILLQVKDFESRAVMPKGDKIIPRIYLIEPAFSMQQRFDSEKTIQKIHGLSPGVAIVDMRLEGDEPNDYSGVDLSLKIKSIQPDCCVILVSAYFKQTAAFLTFEHLDVLRFLVDRSKPADKFVASLIDCFTQAILTYVSSINYRRQRFISTVNKRSQHMWGLVLEPNKKGIHIHNRIPVPYLKSDSVMVRTIELGVCGTDRASLGMIKTPPYELIDFHEAFGEVVWTGEAVRGLQIGDLVVPMVRRCMTWDKPKDGQSITAESFNFSPCNMAISDCLHQADNCPKGRFSGSTSKQGNRFGYISRGTGWCHGFGSKYFIDTEDWLVRITPPDENEGNLRTKMMKRYVLAEPMSIAWKMHHEILKHYNIREYTDKILIIGLGPIGLLVALVMSKLHPGLHFAAVDLFDDLNERVELLNEIHDFTFYTAEKKDQTPIDLKNNQFQIIIEATNQPENVFKYASSLLAPGGILVLLGIPEDEKKTIMDADTFSRLVRQGNTIIGSVNSSRADFEDSINFMQRVIGDKESVLDEMVERWPIDNDLPDKLIDILGNTEPKDRKEIKVVLKAEGYTV